MKSSTQRPDGAPAARAPSACTPCGSGSSSPGAALATPAHAYRFCRRTVAAQDQPCPRSLPAAVSPGTHPPASQAPAPPGRVAPRPGALLPAPTPPLTDLLWPVRGFLGSLLIPPNFSVTLLSRHRHPGLAQQPALRLARPHRAESWLGPGAVSADPALPRARCCLLEQAGSGRHAQVPPASGPEPANQPTGKSFRAALHPPAFQGLKGDQKITHAQVRFSCQ